MPIVLFAAIFPIIIGLLLRLPKLIFELKENKQWSFDWGKFIAIALPCVFIILMSLLPFIPLGIGTIKIPSIIMLNAPTLQMIAGIVLGYTILDSLLNK